MSDYVTNFHAWLSARNENIKLLRRLAVELDEMQEKLDIAKIFSTAGSIVSGVSSVICFVLAVPTGGISTIPGLIAGGFGVGSLGISVGASIFEHLSEKDLMQKVQNALDKDRRESFLLIKKHISNLERSRKCLGRVSAVNTCIGTVAKQKKITTAVPKVLAANFLKKTARVGFVLNVLIVPLDIVILVDTCIKADKGSTHKAASKIREIIKQLEDERDQIVNGW